MRQESDLIKEIIHYAQAGKFKEWAQIISFLAPFPFGQKMVFPKREGRLVNIIEVLGTPDSGKTEGILNAQEKLFRKVKIIHSREFDTGKDNLIFTRGSESFKPYLVTNEHEIQLNAFIKLVSLKQTFRKILDSLTRNSDYPLIVFIEGGPFDVLRDCYWMQKLSRGKKVSEHFDSDPQEEIYSPLNALSSDYHKNYWELFFSALVLANYVDAMVIYSASWETTKKRAQKIGLGDGYVRNPAHFPHLLEACSWVYGSIYPLVRSYYGTGLCLIDGEKNLKINNNRLLKYTNYLASQLWKNRVATD